MNLADLSIKRPIFITCIVILLLVVGYMSLKSLPVDLFPDVNFPIVTVTTVYPGAGPSEIETLVTKPVEDELSTISGMKRLTSKSFEGVSQVVAEFRLETDIKYAEQQIRDRVSVAKTKMPREAKEPVIRRIDPADQAILSLSLESDLAPAELFDVADQMVKPRFEQIKDVGTVDIVGGRKREIHVYMDRNKLRDREIPVVGVAARLASSGQNIPSGKVNEGKSETVFRSLGEFKNVGEISNTLISMYGNDVPTKLSDVGRVADTLEDEKSRAFVNGKKAIFIEVFRQSGSNTLAVVKSVKATMEKLNAELVTQKIPAKLVLVRDAGKKIADNVYDVQETISIGILLTILVVFFFLGSARSTFITGMALPNSLLGAFILMAVAGFSINIVTLLSLSLAVGLLIDDAIVVRENIFRKLENGADPVTAASEGTKEVTLAVVATTLVIIAMFGPVAFMKGIVGQFLKQFGLTICFAMMISLFDALTIAPMLSAYFAGRTHDIKHNPGGIWGNTVGALVRAFDRFQTWLENKYEALLGFTLKWPSVTLGISFVVFLVSMATVIKIPRTFIPQDGMDEFMVTLELPSGSNLDETNLAATKADEIVRGNKEVAVTAVTVGSRNGEANFAQIYVRMTPSNLRKIDGVKLKDIVRDQIRTPLAGANPKVINYDPAGAGATSPFMMNLVGSDQKELELATAKLGTYLKNDKRLVEVDTNFRPGKPEFQVTLKPGAAERYGISTRSMGEELRAQVEGITPAKFRQDGREYDIRVRLLPEQRNIREGFGQILVPNVNNRLVRLAAVADGEQRGGPSVVNRQDRGRYVQFTADVAQGYGIGEVISDMDRHLASADGKLPSGVRSVLVGNSENFKELGESMILAIGTGLLFVFLVLASLYESFITPFTIMLALPLALCGAFVGIFLFNGSLNLFAGLGIVMLLGVASKNSILLVDYTLQLMREGMERVPAVVLAGRTRLRPILMTSFALIAGMIPVAIGLNEASKQRTSMGLGIIGGLISSTVLTLVVVPSAFLYVDRFRVWFEGQFRRLSGAGTLSADQRDKDVVVAKSTQTMQGAAHTKLRD